MRKLLMSGLATAALLAGCDQDDTMVAGNEAAEIDADALDARLLAEYVEAINSHDTDRLMDHFTDDVVIMAPNEPALIGTEAVRGWVAGFHDAIDSTWEKRSLDFEVEGDMALHRYAYEADLTMRDSGQSWSDSGKGLNVYRRDEDGNWRIAYDAWNTDAPMAGQGEAPNKAIIQGVYEAFATGDIAAVTEPMAASIVWNEAEGNPLADRNPYEGPDAVVEGVFMRLGEALDGFRAEPSSMVADGNKVVVFGRYSGTHRESGYEHDSPFVHEWTVEDGEITAFQQYTDTKEWTETLGG